MPEIQLPRLHESAHPPLPGYEHVELQVLLNPTKATWHDWSEANLSTADGRTAYGRALHAFYGTSETAGLDFSTPEAALATIERDDVPDELVWWLLSLPDHIVERRRTLIREQLPKSFATGSAT